MVGVKIFADADVIAVIALEIRLYGEVLAGVPEYLPQKCLAAGGFGKRGVVVFITQLFAAAALVF